MPTIAQEYIREGLERGREEARASRRQTILELLQLRLDVPPSRYTAELEQIDDLEQLQLLLRQAALATDVAEFEETLAALRSDQTQRT